MASLHNKLQSKHQPFLGCIADDVTGATDLSLNLVEGGMSVVQLLDLPTAEELQEVSADAIVIALKTRSVPAADAIEQSCAALAVLQAAGCQSYFFKYCSTFDSTVAGNIGPVAEALMKQIGADKTIFCPAFPENGRTVYQGHLFVHGKLLHESGMQHHPLTPMTDANLVRVLHTQSTLPIGLLSYDQISNGSAAATTALQQLADNGQKLIITDALDNDHLRTIAAATATWPLLTGGSGIARELPGIWRSRKLLTSQRCELTLPAISGRALIIAGSCSAATQRQVALMKSRCAAVQIDAVQAVADPQALVDSILEFAARHTDGPLMVYSTVSSEELSALQSQLGGTVVANVLETVSAEIGRRLVDEQGFRKLVVAGGETSGAVMRALKIRALRIGPRIAAGVPWTESIGQQPLAIALKSGNFGDDAFFETAIEMLQ
jgi:uncharacterized protein YgbK (DUF1537 family)